MNLLKEFIMEQDLYGVQEAQLIAEMNVLSSMIDCYTKQEMIMEHCSDESVLSEFSIFTEADASSMPMDTTVNAAKDSDKLSPKKTNILKKLWNKFLMLITQITVRIANFFSKTSIKSLIEMVEKCPDNTMFVMDDCPPPIASFTILADIVDVFTPLINSIWTGKMSVEDTRKYQNIIERFEKNDMNKETYSEISKREMLDVLNKLRNNSDMPSSIKKLDKICKQKSASGELSDEAVAMFESKRDMLNKLIKCYNRSFNYNLYLQQAVIKSCKKKADTAAE